MQKISFLVFSLLLFLPLIFQPWTATAKTTAQEPIEAAAPSSPQEICPLLPGTKIPPVSLTTTEGQPADVQKLTEGKHSVIIFYRGGW